eukprot:Amastigsp_a842633_145.p6 type:complete len:123 gc:universal Amastigsp_a842633_145:1924-2292(+)
MEQITQEHPSFMSELHPAGSGRARSAGERQQHKQAGDLAPECLLLGVWAALSALSVSGATTPLHPRDRMRFTSDPVLTPPAPASAPLGSQNLDAPWLKCPADRRNRRTGRSRSSHQMILLGV